MVSLSKDETAHIDGMFCVVLLNDTNCRVCDKDEEDDRGLHKGTKRRSVLGVLE